MSAIQSRFEVAVPELPDHIDPASYSMFSFPVFVFSVNLKVPSSDLLIVLLPRSSNHSDLAPQFLLRFSENLYQHVEFSFRRSYW
jgi:hypothetical protein